MDNRQSSTNINWYPGHMAKTKRLIKEELPNIDVVYEIIDARIPYSSKIKDIDTIVKDKPKILIMTKKDLCNLDMTKKWQTYYENLGYNVILLDLKQENDYDKVIKMTQKLTLDMQNKRKDKGLNPKEVRALVIGIPNVGKSTLINRLTGKKVTNVENRPGVTTNLTYLKTKSNIVILDTPGILWPKLDEEEVALNIASTGGIKKDILNIDEICVHILNTLYNYYPNIIKDKYGIIDGDIMEMYETIAKRIGAYKNGEVNYDKVSEKVYNDVVGGFIKGVTFDIYESRFTKI